MEITHLVVNGCSWTYCSGLDNPKVQGWPALLAQKLNLPVVNLALPGSGGGSIHRRSYEYMYQNLPTGSKPLFLIFWTQYWRREAWFEGGGVNGSLIQDYNVVNPTASSKEPHVAALLDHWNEEDFIRQTLLYKLSLQSLFRSQKIPYLIADYSSCGEQLDTFDLDQHNSLKDAVNTDPYCIPRDLQLVSHLNTFKQLPCGHEGPEAQQVLANWWEQKLKVVNQWNIKPITGTNFLTLDNYQIKKTNPYTAWK